MIVDVEVPNQGLTITEATLVQWNRQVGETVAKGDILFEMETDKAVQEIEAPVSGTLLSHLASAGEVVPLGRIVARIGTEPMDRLEQPQSAQPQNTAKDGVVDIDGFSGTPPGAVARGPQSSTPSNPALGSLSSTPSSPARGPQTSTPSSAAPGSQSSTPSTVSRRPQSSTAGSEAPDRVSPPAGPIARAAPEADTRVPPNSAGAGIADRRRTDNFVVSPRARRAAVQLGVDLATIVPTGGRGRHIRETDVVQAHNLKLANNRPLSSAENRSVGAYPPPTLDAVPAPDVCPLPTPNTVSATVPYGAHAPDVVPMPPNAAPAALSRIRTLTAGRTAASFREVPHFYLTREVLADRLVSLRAELVNDLEQQAAMRVSITDFLLKALALSLRAFPPINSQWSGEGIVPLVGVDIGLAVDTPQGLVAPIVRAANSRTLLSIARERLSLAESARAGRLRPEQMAGGSFTLTNLGSLGVDQFDPIIVPPQSGILAAGSIKKRPFVVDDQLKACHTLFLTLAMDHRVTDGTEAARFLDRIATLLEKPALLCAL